MLKTYEDFVQDERFSEKQLMDVKRLFDMNVLDEEVPMCIQTCYEFPETIDALCQVLSLNLDNEGPEMRKSIPSIRVNNKYVLDIVGKMLYNGVPASDIINYFVPTINSEFNVESVAFSIATLLIECRDDEIFKAILNDEVSGTLREELVNCARCGMPLEQIKIVRDFKGKHSPTFNFYRAYKAFDKNFEKIQNAIDIYNDYPEHCITPDILFKDFLVGLSDSDVRKIIEEFGPESKYRLVRFYNLLNISEIEYPSQKVVDVFVSSHMETEDFDTLYSFCYDTYMDNPLKSLTNDEKERYLALFIRYPTNKENMNLIVAHHQILTNYYKDQIEMLDLSSEEIIEQLINNKQAMERENIEDLNLCVTKMDQIIQSDNNDGLEI